MMKTVITHRAVQVHYRRAGCLKGRGKTAQSPFVGQAEPCIEDAWIPLDGQMQLSENAFF